MLVLMFYFVFSIVTGEKITISMLALAILIDMSNCMSICFVNNMVRVAISRAKIDVVRELNKGKIKCQD